MGINRDEITERLQKKMTPERFKHTMGVMYTAAALAMRYDTDVEQALTAGLLHDCAKTKDLTGKKLLNICDKNNIKVTKAEAEKPSLLHAKVGTYLAAMKYEIKDKEILTAIACHTTGKPKMTTLDKILYVADFIEPNRMQAAILPEVRKWAFVDLDECLFRILEDSLVYLEKRGTVIDPKTTKTYNYYKKEMKK